VEAMGAFASAALATKENPAEAGVTSPCEGA
jgi:hypothetical protein